MIDYIGCPTRTERLCGANLFWLVYRAGVEEQLPTVRVRCPLCREYILVTLKWEERPVIVNWQATPEAGA